MTVRIYQPAKTAMQSGQAKTQAWVLEFAPGSKMPQDPLMGWNSSLDTKEQLKVGFSSLEAAVKYATRNRLEYQVVMSKKHTPLPKAYADNFRYDKVTT